MKRFTGMQILRTGIGLAVLLVAGIQILHAGGISHRASLELVSMWGTSSYEITFEDGISTLEWPMDIRLSGKPMSLAGVMS